ncbi:hypothetical protein CK203_058060 [Vitis vinifera]|uniref:D-isomer specific 2-hydroxyacid dehydrogenase NAD-binding domain-containing protein n=1 Tax=Vitis vinifera TaxID=29760 RepID=A0A438GEZ9_VITVI|nr:hypothetical protein CK203_058060 [Vitis vinifera]
MCHTSLHEGVDINAATKCGIKVARIASGETGNAASCAEMAIYLMLGLLRKQKEMQISLKQKIVGEPIGDTLFGKTVFIMGFGNIGIDLAKRLRPFGVRILATKRSWASQSLNSSQSNGFPTPNDNADELVDEKGGHEAIYDFASSADIVVCCLRLNSETAAIIDKKFISSMRKVCLLLLSSGSVNMRTSKRNIRLRNERDNETLVSEGVVDDSSSVAYGYWYLVIFFIKVCVILVSAGSF